MIDESFARESTGKADAGPDCQTVQRGVALDTFDLLTVILRDAMIADGDASVRSGRKTAGNRLAALLLYSNPFSGR